MKISFTIQVKILAFISDHTYPLSHVDWWTQNILAYFEHVVQSPLNTFFLCFFGALPFVNPCRWLVSSINLVPRPLHDDGVNDIPWNSYYDEVKLFLMHQGQNLIWPKGRELGWTKMKPKLLPLGCVRVSYLLWPKSIFRVNWLQILKAFVPHVK